ncbi:MAG: response regulator [Candidatus Levybacteria bacterium]|nr:response regulator [Candidatus Levybacteria bacterium]
MKVLLVDDDEALGLVFSTAIQKEGFDVIVSKDGRSGLNTAKEQKPDLILLDQVLPDISGNDVLQQLKADLNTKSIPVMMLSNFGQEELVKQAIDRGAIDYVFKYQVEMQDIVDKVKNVLKTPAQQAPPQV